MTTVLCRATARIRSCSRYVVSSVECPAHNCTDWHGFAQYFQIASADASCKQWQGNSGKNAMKNGVCNTGACTYSYDQWTNCDCSGTIGASKSPGTAKCTVDNPNNLCQQVTSYTSCSTACTYTPYTVASNHAVKHQMNILSMLYCVVFTMIIVLIL